MHRNSIVYTVAIVELFQKLSTCCDYLILPIILRASHHVYIRGEIHYGGFKKALAEKVDT